VAVVVFSPDGRTFLTGSGAGHLATRSSVTGTSEQVSEWVQVVTGLRFDDNGAVQVLDGSAWQQCRERLNRIGVPVERCPAALSGLRNPANTEPGPFSRQHLSGS
jgi:hypothetical protein